MIEIDLAVGFAKTLGAVAGALLVVVAVTWCAVGTSEFLRHWDDRKGRRK